MAPFEAPFLSPLPSHTHHTMTSQDSSHHHLLKQYYKTLFPSDILAKYYTPVAAAASSSSSSSTNDISNNNKSHPLKHREFSFTRGEIYMRYKSFTDGPDLQKSLLRIIPDKIDIGAIFNQDPSHKSPDLQPQEKEFCIDIDISDYDDVRACCKGASLCEKCWPLMHSAIEILNFALKKWFAFENIMWVFSGRRGIHGWISDARVMKYNHQERSAVAEFIHLYASNENNKDKIQLSGTHPMFGLESELYQIAEKWFLQLAHDMNWIHDLKICEFIHHQGMKKAVSELIEENQASPVEILWPEIKKIILNPKKFRGKDSAGVIHKMVYTFVYPRLDINVSKQTHHLLKSPFVVHPKTDLVCMVIPDDQVLEFVPDTAPTLTKLVQEKDQEALRVFKESVDTFEKHASSR